MTSKNNPKVSRGWSKPTTYLSRFGDAMQLLCNGRRPDDQMLLLWLEDSSDILQVFAMTHGPAWAQGIALIDAAIQIADNPTEGVEHERRPAVQS